MPVTVAPPGWPDNVRPPGAPDWDGLASVRTSLRGEVRPDVVETAAEIWLEQGAALMRTRRAVGLIGEALRGRTFLARL